MRTAVRPNTRSRSRPVPDASKLRALTVRQPWASFIAEGIKRYETRGWETSYRGRIAIHAGKRRADWVATPLPLGAVIAIATIVDIYPADAVPLSDLERSLGDFSHGRFAWELADIEVIDPVPCRGYQGIWLWTPPAAVHATQLRLVG